MKRSGEHLRSYRHKTALGMTDEQLAALAVPATVLLRPDPRTHLELLVPFVRKHTPALA